MRLRMRLARLEAITLPPPLRLIVAPPGLTAAEAKAWEDEARAALPAGVRVKVFRFLEPRDR
ncbi:hypothetical protein [Muricoccus radiodurans]|uniref:hypothetical protein n=1 Tax=Muricoccus radiodurans TaxID=2231721 RepID=UPI003CEA965A